MLFQTWFLPLALLATATIIAFPLSRYIAWIMDGKYCFTVFNWFEKRIHDEGQNWKQYIGSLLLFNTVLFIFSYLVLALQPLMPLNPDGKTLLAPTTIFHSAISFMTNTDLQHYSGEQHLSNFSQIFFGISNLFLSAAIGLCALMAITRALRGDEHLGNFFLDIWRAVVYLFIPIALIFSLIFLQQGCPMTLKSSYQISTLEKGAMGVDEKGSAKPQTIVVGPVAAFEAIKMLGTNGGGFYAMNSAHPFENPTAISNFFNALAMMIFPFALVLTYGRMLKQMKHGIAVFLVMLILMSITIIWSVYFDTLKPNPAITAHPEKIFHIVNSNQSNDSLSIKIPYIASLPVDQHLGNLEGKEIRFGTSAGATFASLTTDVTCGAVNAEADSLNPLAALGPMIGMWLNCFFGGKGVGMVNMLLFIIVGIFLAGMMVGRTPEYLGKKIDAREIKLAIIALLVHPFLILLPTGLFSATSWGLNAITNPGAHGLSQILYQFSSSSANNGSAFDGLNVIYGFYNNPDPQPEAIYWDIVGGIVIAFGRFFPIIAPVAMAAFLGEKKSCPFGMGTLRVNTFTFGCLLLGTIIVIGALLFLPVAALGPIAEHFGPIPFS
jgi:K+-transporting ATPase ATPase A chain